MHQTEKSLETIREKGKPAFIPFSTCVSLPHLTLFIPFPNTPF